MSDITTKLQSLARWLRQLATHEPEPECKASHIECADDCIEVADEIDRLRAANRHLIDMHDAVIDDARKYTAAQAEIARLREAVRLVIEHDESDPDDSVAMMLAYADALNACRAALAQVAEVPK